MRWNGTSWLPGILLAVFCLGGTGWNAYAADGSKLKVVATTSIIGDWTRNVGGNDVEITALVGPDGDPHEYQPVPADSIAMGEATLIFENDLGLEHWLDKLYAGAGATATRIVLSKNIEPRHIGDSQIDPHVWQSIRNGAVMVGNIRDALVKTDPAHSAGYVLRADSYIKQLNELDTVVMDQIHSIPVDRRRLVTSHDAFGYFGDRYGIEISHSALESVTTEASDPSARQIAEVVDQIKASGVPVIFVENIQNPKLINQIAAEAGVKVGPPLYSDALGRAGSEGDTYLKMMKYNALTLAKALKP